MSKFLVDFCWKGKMIWRVGEGETRGEARMNARRKEWNKFKEAVLKGSDSNSWSPPLSDIELNDIESEGGEE